MTKPATPGRRQSLREQILARRDVRGEIVTPSFLNGQTVEVCVLTVGERRDLFAQATGEDGAQDPAVFEALTVIHCVCIPGTRKRLFTQGDKDTLIELPAPELDELAEPALRVNGLLISGVRTALKNSAPTPSESSSTDSPNASA